MPLTAYDPESGHVILFGDAAAIIQCRDPACRADMHRVKQTDQRVAHFRHSTHSECPNRDATREGESASPWHIWWQQQADSPERMEYSHRNEAGDIRRADILTKFGWAIEVQHSAIKPQTARARENHWGGRVLWLINAASDDRPADVTVDRLVRVTCGWVDRLRTLVAVDNGEDVWLLPPSGFRGRVDTEALASKCIRYRREEFVSSWVNGEALPLDGDVATPWTAERDRRRREQDRARSENAERLARAAARQAQEMNSYTCEYQGQAQNLIHSAVPQVDVAPTTSPVIPTDGGFRAVADEHEALPVYVAQVEEREAPPQRAQLHTTDIGPCARCQTLIVRYGPEGRPLCALCHYRSTTQPRGIQ